MPQSTPQVARVEDYDSDESSVKPGTRKEARKKFPAPAPPKALSRYKTAQVDGASDSGYSSRTSGTQASNASAGVQTAGPVQPPPRPSTAHGQVKSKPVIHKTDSQPTRPRAPSRSASTSRRGSEQCNDPNCQHSGCLAVRYPGRRFSITQQQAAQYAAQYGTSPVAYQQMPQYQYAQVSHAQSTQAVPTLSSYPQPRLRSGSTSRPRPTSIHGYPFQPTSGTSTPGPPPSSSAYLNMTVDEQWAYYQAQLLQQQRAAYQQQQQQAAAYAAAAARQAQSQPYPFQTQPSPVQTSPTSPKFSQSARLQRAYSARIATPLSASGTSTPHPIQTPLSRNPSQRQMSARAYHMPGAFPSVDADSSDSESSSEDSSSEMSDEEYEREQRARGRDSRLMSSSSQRRPSMNKYKTEPAVPQARVARELLHRNPRSDYVLDHPSSSDNMDSDRTTRAMVDRPRTTYTDSTRSSRRPSLSTTASSGRTRATTMSSATSGMASLVIGGKNGRDISYLSKRDQAALHRKYAREQEEEEQRRQANIEAYQDAMRGGKLSELTAEKLKMQQMHSSAGGYAHSRKSSRSSSRAYNPQEGLRIESGGTTIHVYGDQKVEMIAGQNGGAASLVIGSRDGRGSTYIGGSSKSSSSRAGRSQGGSDVGVRREQVIQEEYGSEQPTI